jgi:hypothetical protein
MGLLRTYLKKIPLLVSIKRKLELLFKKDPFSMKQSANFRILSEDYGQFKSIKTLSCIDRHGSPIPWYTYPAIEYLNKLDFSTKTVFEYGSGNSSLWWASRCKSLISVEHNKEWYNKIKQAGVELRNFDYRLAEDKTNYIHHRQIAGADIVIIDGEHRPDCVDYFLRQKSQGGIESMFLIFDNSDWFPKTIARLNQATNWIQVDFAGFGPINDYTWTTSIFINPLYRPRLTYIRNLGSIASFKQEWEEWPAPGLDDTRLS